MLRANYHKYKLYFKHPAGTSRGILHHRDCYFLLLQNTNQPGVTGIGECGVIPGLSYDDRPGFEARLARLCEEISQTGQADPPALQEWPSIGFALETALRDLETGGRRLLYKSEFTSGTVPIPINGLIWMGNEAFMRKQLEEKLAEGHQVIKIKVGAIDFETELKLIASIRKHVSEKEVTIRLDANGAFGAGEALDKLNRLSQFHIHSIEQPIRQGQQDLLAALCQRSPIPIALDEELIGITGATEKKELLHAVRPPYIILKPSLLGGFHACNEWIRIARETGTGWWVTSALESNIGLNAIAQWTATHLVEMPQGLGTGALYTNNIPSPLESARGFLWHRPQLNWRLAHTGALHLQNPGL